MTRQNPIMRVLGLLKTRKKAVLFLFLLVFFSLILDLSVPFITQNLIDRFMAFFKNGGAAPVNILVFSAVGILAVTVFSRFLRSTYDYRLFMEVTQREDAARSAVLEKYYKLHVMFHHGASSGQIIGRIERGASAIYTILHDILGQNFVPPVVIFVGVAAALIYKDPLIALAVFWPLPVYIASIQRIMNRIYEIERKVNEEFEAVSKESYDIAANILTVKKFFQEKPELDNQMKLLRKARATQYSAERLWKIMENLQTFLATAGRIGVIIVGGMFVINGRSTLGEFVLYIALNNMVYVPTANLANILPRLRRNLPRVERLFALLDEPVLVTDKPGAVPLPYHGQKIEFKQVTFCYGKGHRTALKNVNVAIKAGERVALVGRSGSGKTTFVNLLLRSFDPENGSVLIDGHDLRDVTRESLLNQTAVVPQEVDLFSRTIFENIAYGKPEANKEEVVRAAKTALAHDFITRAERGYDTLVGERGIKLSGGERQRIGIARAVLRDPKILILDEATSHLDTESEKLIAKATDTLIQSRTTFIIAHRLSTVLGADRILVFNNGEIEAMGKHEELLEKSPTYRKLYSLQFSKE